GLEAGGRLSQAGGACSSHFFRSSRPADRGARGGGNRTPSGRDDRTWVWESLAHPRKTAVFLASRAHHRLDSGSPDLVAGVHAFPRGSWRGNSCRRAGALVGVGVEVG